jgi:hypothetical protein
MGQTALEGIVGPLGKKPSRFTLVLRDSLDDLSIASEWRDPVKTFQEHTKALNEYSINKAEGQRMLDEQGLLPYLVCSYSLSNLNNI